MPCGIACGPVSRALKSWFSRVGRLRLLAWGVLSVGEHAVGWRLAGAGELLPGRSVFDFGGRLCDDEVRYRLRARLILLLILSTTQGKSLSKLYFQPREAYPVVQGRSDPDFDRRLRDDDGDTGPRPRS